MKDSWPNFSDFSKEYFQVRSNYSNKKKRFTIGFCIIHLFLIFAGSSAQTILSSYVLSALRIYQIVQVVALLCALGACNRYLETKSKCNFERVSCLGTNFKIVDDAVRYHPQMKESLKSQLVKYGIASLSFFIVYALVIFNHEFVSKISDQASTIDA